MTPPIEVLAPSLPAGAVEAFESDVRLAAAIYDHLREDSGLPDAAVRVVLADDFVGEVEKYLSPWSRRDEGGSFTTERAGGVVVGKSLDQIGDGSDVVIVLNASLWKHAEEPEVRLTVAHVVAHELAHALIERSRHVSGVMDGVFIPSSTGHEIATSMARIMVGEYGADRLADAIVSGYITATVNDEVVPAFDWMRSAEPRTESVQDVVGKAHPRWPDLVQEYRESRMDLGEMFRTVQASIDETLTTLVHAQAGADGADAGRDLVAEEAVACLPAARLYLADTWAPFLVTLREGPQICSLAEFRAWDEAATEVGRDTIMEIWRRLGLTILDHGGRQWGLKVDEPLR